MDEKARLTHLRNELHKGFAAAAIIGLGKESAKSTAIKDQMAAINAMGQVGQAIAQIEELLRKLEQHTEDFDPGAWEE